MRALSSYDCLALDIGGVICADTWESLFLTTHTGLAAHYGLDPKIVLKKGAEIWELYAYSRREEEDYWKSWEDALRQKIDRALISSLYEQTIWVDESAAPLITECLDNGMQVAFVSNSASFWFPMQMKRAGLEKIEHRIMRFLSHETGFEKTHDRGGLVQLAARINPARTLFVDDKHENASFARKLGMSAIHYQRDVHGNLAGAFEKSRAGISDDVVDP